MQPSNNNGSIIIRFMRFGQKYSLTKLGDFNDAIALSKAKEICIAIQTDIDIGRFTCKNNDELFTQYHPLADLAIANLQGRWICDALSLVEAYTAKRDYKSNVLTPITSLLREYSKPIHSTEDANKFWTWMINDGKRSNSSNNRYLQALKPICPMFAHIPMLKANKVKREKPFSKDEIKKIIDAFDSDYPHYSALVKFLFSTGCRTGEAIALRWENVDFENRTINICESIAINGDGVKVHKVTKTDTPRIVAMNDKLYKLLEAQDKSIVRREFQGIQVNFVFPSLKASLIDINNFRVRYWTKALKKAGIPYRTLYNTRHTFVSHFIADNLTGDAFLKCASITHGTKSGVQTLIKHYAHLVNKVELPDMF